MKNNNLPLAIILKRTQNGYTFQTLQELPLSKDKNKKPKPGRKPASKGVPNRLIKQIGLINQQLVANTTPLPEPQQIQPFQDQIQDHPPIYPQLNEQEQVSCQIDRQNDLPKTPANWFDKTKVHERQKIEMKEFFSGSQSKKPELYLKYRNFMVEAYQKNPKRYLSKIACRRILRGDVNTIMKIHSFLQKHGIINFSLNYDGNYTFKSSSLSKPFEQTTKPQTTLKSLPLDNEETAQKQIDTDNMTLTVINKNFSRTYRACCNQCKLICGILWFGNVSEEQSSSLKNLCYECWNKKSESEKKEYEKVDIVKRMQAHGRDGKSFTKNAWNIEQNIKLLDFMSNSKQQKSWRKLLNEFGGKRTIEDIVLQFLQFPISNTEIKKSKTQLLKHLSKVEQVDLGVNHQDYKNILRKFYEESHYNKKKNQKQVKINGCGPFDYNKIQGRLNQRSSTLTEILTLTMQKIKVQVQSLKEQEEFIFSETANFASQICLQKYKTSIGEEEELGKQTNDLQNRSKSVKNLGDKKNESSQIFDDIEADGHQIQDN